MAFRAAAVRQWRSRLINSTAQSRSCSSTAASTASRKYATTANMHADQQPKPAMGDWAPIMILGGFTAVAVCLASHSAWQQLAYAPSVQIQKKKRETLPEVYSPDVVLGSANKFINKSFLRKVGHIQDNKPTLEDPTRPDPYTHPRKIESLKSVGVIGK